MVSVCVRGECVCELCLQKAVERNSRLQTLKASEGIVTLHWSRDWNTTHRGERFREREREGEIEAEREGEIE